VAVSADDAPAGTTPARSEVGARGDGGDERSTVQEVHEVVLHVLCEALDEALGERAAGRARKGSGSKAGTVAPCEFPRGAVSLED
jgi:hypothetical protein